MFVVGILDVCICFCGYSLTLPVSFLSCEMQIEKASNYEDSTPIEVDSNGEEVVKVDSRVAKRPTTTRTGAYRPRSTTGGVGNCLLYTSDAADE